MSATSIAILVLLVLAGTAALPLVAARRAGPAFATDIALLLAPAPAFISALLAFNRLASRATHNLHPVPPPAHFLFLKRKSETCKARLPNISKNAEAR